MLVQSLRSFREGIPESNKHLFFVERKCKCWVTSAGNLVLFLHCLEFFNHVLLFLLFFSKSSRCYLDNRVLVCFLFSSLYCALRKTLMCFFFSLSGPFHIWLSFSESRLCVWSWWTVPFPGDSILGPPCPSQRELGLHKSRGIGFTFILLKSPNSRSWLGSGVECPWDDVCECVFP